METTKIRCTCSCHTSNGTIMHMLACCNNGWIEQPVLQIDKRYYIPEAEEFHVGFEYEVKSNIGKGFYTNSFGDSNGEYINELSEMYIGIKNQTIRVKYLDKKDIESLGFVFETSITERTDRYYYIYALQTKMLYNKEDHTIRIAVHTDVPIFNGKIKNKSELIKLMKQLNIMK